jgi:response regulator RpfG family c-di-GMP phosphodiesterase
MATGWKEFRREGKLPADEQLRKLGLLVVDDESEIVEALRDVFREHFEIHRATSAQEALALFKEHGPKVVVTDQRMPEMSGLELLRHIKEIDPSTVRILVTGYSDINVVIQALNEGLVWRYVTKPWDHGELRALVMAGARAYLKEHGLDAQAFRFDGLLGA